LVGYREAAQMIAAGKFVPVYLFYGDEPFLIRELSHQLAEAFLGEEGDFGREKIEGAALPLLEILQRLGEASLFAPCKLLLVDDPPYLLPKGRESRETAEGEAALPEEGGEKAAALLERFIEREGAAGVPSRILLFRAAAVDRRRRLFKILEKGGLVVECAPLRGPELARWIRERLARRGVKMEPAALQRILWSGENDLHFLSNELNKFCAYLGEGEKTITAKMVELLFSGDIKSSVFTLADALSEGRLDRALQVLSHLLAGRREEPLRIFFMLVRHFRLLLGARSLRDEKVPPAQHAAALGVKPFEARKLYGQAAAFSRQSLEEIIIFLQQLDYRVKTGRVSPGHALEMALSQIHHLSLRR